MSSNNLANDTKDLPVELSFLIRQQAYCMARMNYLDRQIRELQKTQGREIQNDRLHGHINLNNNQQQQVFNAQGQAVMGTTTKNGNFILSDDSGCEYSRATISDEDELSSLLDQIAKSVRPDQNKYNYQPQQQQIQLKQQPPQLINTSQLHHQQTVPIFVMSSPIVSVAQHPSNILPGVHFQPESRYNQYYNTSTNRPMASVSNQFDSSITAIEQKVSQREKRQIMSQLKTADNWLKMRLASNGGKTKESCETGASSSARQTSDKIKSNNIDLSQSISS